MQSFNTQNQPATFQREDEQTALQRAKLEGRHETDDEHLSEPSTIHSLSHFEEHETPTKTPKSSEILQKGFHKATDTIAQGVEGIKNLLTPSHEKMDQAKESISQEVSNLHGDFKQKAGQLKGKAAEKFGGEIQPEKDLDQEVKEHIKEVNEEIRHQPHGEEEVVEGQGHAKYKPKDSSSQKASQLKGKLDSQLESLKQKASEFKGKMNQQMGEEIQPEKDLDSEVKKQIKEVNEEIKHQPHGQEEVVEGQGQARTGTKAQFSSSSQKTGELKGKASSQLEGLKQSSKEIMDKASAKVDELKQKAGQQARPVKQQAQEFSSRASGKTEEAGDQGISQFEDLRCVSKEILDKALGKIEEMRDKANQQGQQFKQETKSASNQFSQKLEQKTAGSQKQSENQTHVQVEEGSQPLTKDAKEEILELAQQITEKVQELETEQKLQSQSKSKSQSQSQSQSSQSQSQSFGQQQQQQTLGHEGHEHHQLSAESQSFVPTEETHELVEKVKEGLEEHVPLTEVVEEFENEHHHESSQLPSFDQAQPVDESLKPGTPGAQELSSQIYHKEYYKSKFGPSQEKFDFTQESYKAQEKPPGFEEKLQSEEPVIEEPVVEQIKQGAPEAPKTGLAETVQEVKETVSQKAAELQEQRKPLVDKIMNRIHNVGDNFHHQVDEMKSAFKVEEKQPEKQQSEVERKPIIDVIQKNITGLSSKLSHNIESVKSKAKPVHEESSTQKPVVREQPAELPHEQEHQSLRQRISGGIGAVSDKLSHHVENVKHRFMPEKGERDAGEFHKVKEGFSEDVGEFKHEQRLQSLGGHELQSENPFEPFEKLTQEQLEQRNMVEKVKEGFFEGLENLKVKLGKEPWSEEIRDVEPVEAVKEESQGLKQKLSGSLEGLKGRFRHGKEEAQKEVSKKASEQSLEKPAESGKQEGQSLKKKLGEGLESFKGRFKSGKEEVHEEVLEKVGEIQPVEQAAQPVETLQQESQSLKQRISGQLHGLSDKIHHNIETVTGKFKQSKEEVSQNVESSEQPYEALQDEEPAEPSQEGSQSLKHRIAGQIGSLKGRFGAHKGEEAQEEKGPQEDKGEFHVVTEGIDETVTELKREQLGEPLLSSNPFEPLESRDVNISQPLSSAEQVGGNLKKLTSAQKENQPVEQSVEPVKEAGQSLGRRIAGQIHSISSMITHNLDTCKGRLRRQKEEAHEEVSQKIIEKQPIEQSIEQPAESLKQESHSLRQKLSGGLESFKGRFKSGKQDIQEEASQKVEEAESLDEPAEVVQEQGQSIKQKVSGGLESLKGRFKSGKEETQEQVLEKAGEIKAQPVEQPAEAVKEGGQSLKQKISGQFQGISSKLSQNVEAIKGRFGSKKNESQENQEEQGQEGAQQDEGEFHTVKQGIHETVSELRKEQAGEPLLSSNPFQSLGAKDINISQPLSNAEQVGGNLKKLTTGAGIENFAPQEESGPVVEESKSLLQKVKGGFIGATSIISKPFSLTKQKVMSVFKHDNMENVALLGLLKDIEEKCIKEGENNNEKNAQ